MFCSYLSEPLSLSEYDCRDEYLGDRAAFTFCADRRVDPVTAAQCLLRQCTIGPYLYRDDNWITANLDPAWLGLAGPDMYYPTLIRVTERDTNMAPIIAGIIRDNIDRPARFDRQRTYDDSFLVDGAPPGRFTTNALEFVRQLVTAQWNSRTTLYFDDEDVRKAFPDLYYSTRRDRECAATIPTWLDETVTLVGVIEFAAFYIGHGTELKATEATDLCLQTVSGVARPLCSRFEKLTAPDYEDAESRETLAATLTRVLALYNRNFETCTKVATECIVFLQVTPS